jgi:hypothetical protein
LFPSPHHHTFSPKGVAGLSFTVRIEGAHSDRTASASKKDGLVAPYPTLPSLLVTFFKGWPDQFQRARVERGPSQGERSASTDLYMLPPSLLVLPLKGGGLVLSLTARIDRARPLI